MFIKPETDPEEEPAISAVTDQKELWDKYRAPAPPARTTLARRAPRTCDPQAMKIAARIMDTAATPHRPSLAPCDLVRRSLIVPPSRQHTSIARKGSIEKKALDLRSSPRTFAR